MIRGFAGPEFFLFRLYVPGFHDRFERGEGYVGPFGYGYCGIGVSWIPGSGKKLHAVRDFSEMRELMPEDLRKIKVNSDYFSIFKAVALLKSYLGLVYGPGDWISDYDQGQIYLNRELIEQKKINLEGNAG